MGLYDDDKAAVTSGDVLDVCYWQAKFAADQLDAALKTRQPEGAIKPLVPGVVNSCTGVLKDFPNHGDVKRWKEKAEEVGRKIDPNAAPADFKGNFAHWKDYSYEAGWRSYHVAKMAAAAEDWSVANTHAKEAVTQLGRSVTRMAEWPEDVRNWVTSAKSEMEKLQEQASKKR